MNRRLRIGRTFGVEIHVDWSWILTFVLAAWTLVSLNRRLMPDLDTAPVALMSALAAAGLRVETDLRNEKINYKVREHSLAKVPNLIVVGKREAEERTVALRVLGSDARQEVIGLDALVERLKAEALAPDLRVG